MKIATQEHNLIFTAADAIGDHVLLTSHDAVIAAWMITPQVLSAYLLHGSNPRAWTPDRFPGANVPVRGRTSADEFGREVGRNGTLANVYREAYLGDGSDVELVFDEPDPRTIN